MDNKIFYTHQFGFRPACSTEIAAIELISYIAEALDNKKLVSGISMDLKKAFDLVDRKTLLEMFNLSGTRGKINDVIKSYLSERLQKVRISDHISTPQKIEYGVIQESILGSLLYTVCKVEGKMFLLMTFS